MQSEKQQSLVIWVMDHFTSCVIKIHEVRDKQHTWKSSIMINHQTNSVGKETIPLCILVGALFFFSFKLLTLLVVLVLTAFIRSFIRAPFMWYSLSLHSREARTVVLLGMCLLLHLGP
jgi:hypothetical protein